MVRVVDLIVHRQHVKVAQEAGGKDGHRQQHLPHALRPQRVALVGARAALFRWIAPACGALRGAKDYRAREQQRGGEADEAGEAQRVQRVLEAKGAHGRERDGHRERPRGGAQRLVVVEEVLHERHFQVGHQHQVRHRRGQQHDEEQHHRDDLAHAAEGLDGEVLVREPVEFPGGSDQQLQAGICDDCDERQHQRARHKAQLADGVRQAQHAAAADGRAQVEHRAVRLHGARWSAARARAGVRPPRPV
mmetsp:Transcript_14842/g.46227  ORF Transcript_14842/g.46227 Transcript_14842/m.46227 type:complete len:248 (+) Transcript_14842:434-1177(+)